MQLGNAGRQAISVTGWQLRDRAGHSVILHGSVPAGGQLKVALQRDQMPLNNSGDTVELVDLAGAVVNRASYRAQQASAGAVIEFSR